MSAIREWLDGRRFELRAFGCNTDEQSVTFRLEFKYEAEACACADAFQGQVGSTGREGRSDKGPSAGELPFERFSRSVAAELPHTPLPPNWARVAMADLDVQACGTIAPLWS